MHVGPDTSDIRSYIRSVCRLRLDEPGCIRRMRSFVCSERPAEGNNGIYSVSGINKSYKMHNTPNLALYTITREEVSGIYVFNHNVASPVLNSFTVSGSRSF